jgi:hypothetical protein
MPIYLSADRIKSAVRGLGNSRAQKTRLFDFLIVKRTLAVKGQAAVAIAESEPAFLQALKEVGASGLPDDEHTYFNPFALTETGGKNGFRKARYASNGTNTTIGGNKWQEILSLNTDEPRKASLKPGYDQKLARFILVTDKRKQLPHLRDCAVWYWRGQDLTAIVGNAASDDARFARLTDKFVEQIGLNKTELSVLFDTGGNLDAALGGNFVDAPPAPQQYLPIKALPSGPTREDNLAEVSFDLVTALTAKNFVILTGPSGTGKSRAALKLAEGLQRSYAGRHAPSIYELVTVGPDWTSPKRLLGFRTPFGKERKLDDGSLSHDGYEITDAVRLMLRASHSDADSIPHFLIFDEMNLSHVERYFAPFLSLMEASALLDTESGLALIGTDDLAVLARVLEQDSPGSPEAEAAKVMVAEERDFVLPSNVYFVGTVNVDETTYMFSPKVLDRAHVLELSSARPSSYLTGGENSEPGGTLQVRQADELLRRGINDRENQRHAVGNASTILDALADSDFTAEEIASIKRTVITALDGSYDLLTPVGFAFGYRVSKEVFVYIAYWIEAKLASGLTKVEVMQQWPAALDATIVQKILPKIHGNRRALGESLRAFAAFLAGGDGKSNSAAAYTLGTSTRVEIAPANRLNIGENQLERSRRKLDTMHDRLMTTGYVSFIG